MAARSWRSPTRSARLATVVNLREGQGTTTVESKTNFFAGSPMGTRLIAEATPLHRGRRTQVWETRITNEQGGWWRR